MSEFFNIFDDISKKQILKTETGDSRIFGVMTGIVAKNYDGNMPGRVCVTIPVRDTDANELKWARTAMSASGSQYGHYFLPEIGDQVLVAFEQGNIEKPFIIGCIPKDNDSFLQKSVDEDNQIKRIVTKNGNTIHFEDNKEGEGEKDKIKIETPKQAHTVVLDNENKKIVIQDKEKKCQIEMKTENGEINVKANSKLTIEAGNNIKIKMDGESGEIKIEAVKLSVAASSKVNIASDGSAKFSGSQTIIEAASVLKENSSGMVQIQGSPVKIG